ncbi:mitochondrial 2-oxoglutarate/malate carrier protein-like [Salvelinus sp. IW2-2015]|uniref:mitochondrial 2-oxoglutarate/malate carrier protein-like n=1 Tax=Salvelinus sp. IW2-2015 TaxID=2691554 RepID=UPI0038D4993C
MSAVLRDVFPVIEGVYSHHGRAVVVNAAQLASYSQSKTGSYRDRAKALIETVSSYSQSKQALIETGYFVDGIFLHFCASMISGLVTTAASMPVDIVKTRIQNMRMIDGKPEFKNGLDVLTRVIRNEGFFSLWKGFTPYYARLGPHTVLTFILLEQMNKAYKVYFLD